MLHASHAAMNAWTRFGFVALCGVLGVGCLSETRYVCPPGSDVTASTRCGAACASGELSASVCDEVRAACADGRLTAIDCAGIDGDQGVQDMGADQADVGPDMDVVPDMGVDLGPCGVCGVGAPLCNTATMQCVECLSMADCSGDRAQCNAAGECVQCLNNTHCGGPTPVCMGGTCVGCEDAGDCTATDPVCQTPGQTCGDCTTRAHCLPYAALPSCNVGTGACVACDEMNESADCADTPATPRCNANRQCVQCRTNNHCTNPSQSRCNGDNCASCMNDTDCSHLSGTRRCAAGTCRECAPATEATDCAGNTCDPATRMCTGTMIGSQGVCESCVSDTDCSQAGGTFRCIRMDYMGANKGGYCLRAAPGCTRPFLTPIMDTSLSGAASATYCGIDESLVTCDAVNALRRGDGCPSGNASECMADGAVCATVGLADDQCTYTCGGEIQCPLGFSCGGSHCGS
jgi:hypothetical protein